MEARDDDDDDWPPSSSWESRASSDAWDDGYHGYSRYQDVSTSYPPASYSDMPFSLPATTSSSSDAIYTPYTTPPPLIWRTSASPYTYSPAVPPASVNDTNAYKNQYSSSSSSTPPSTPPPTPTPIPEEDREHDPFAPGIISAAVILPLLLLAIVAALIFLLLRRRRKPKQLQQNNLYTPNAYTTTSSSPPPPPQFQPMTSISTSPNHLAVPLGPIITSAQNNAYFTGLDTNSSHGSRDEDDDYAPARRSEGGTTFVDAPPPYKSSKSLDDDDDDAPPPQIEDIYNVSPVERDDGAARWRSPFEDPDPDPDPEADYDGMDEVDVTEGFLYAPGNISSDRLGDLSYPPRRRDEGNPFEDPPSPVHDAGSQHADAEDMRRREWRR